MVLSLPFSLMLLFFFSSSALGVSEEGAVKLHVVMSTDNEVRQSCWQIMSLAQTSPGQRGGCNEGVKEALL